MKDVIVIGGGLMGSSAAWHLSQRGLDTLLLEKQEEEYTNGSSYGEARVSRSLGYDGDILAYLQQRSVIETKKLIDFLNTKDNEQHSMQDIFTTSPVTYLYHKNQIKDYEAVLDQQTDPHDFASSVARAAEKYDMNIPSNFIVIREYKQYSGTMNPRALIRKLHRAIRLSDGTVRYGSHVHSVETINGGYSIRLSDQKEYLTKKIVFAGGPYSTLLLKEQFPDLDKLLYNKRLCLAFLKISSDRYASLSQEEKQKFTDFFPVADMHDTIYYSMIEKWIDNEPLIKVGGHFERTNFENLDTVWNQQLSTEEIDWAIKKCIRYFDILNLPIAERDLEYQSGYSCVYCLNKSEVPYVTPIPDKTLEAVNDMVMISGLSGIGAKGTMTYGLLAADLFTDRTEQDDMYLKTREALGYRRLLNDLLS